MTKKNLVLPLAATAFIAGLAVSAQAQTPAPATPAWTGSAAAGLSFTRGNSRTVSASANVEAQHKWTSNELLLGAGAAYGFNSGTLTEKSIDGKAQYNRLVTDRFYYGVKVDALSDAVASINYRLSVSPLVGYYLIKSASDSLAVEAGPGAVVQKLGKNTRGYATLRLGERYEHKFSPTAKLWQSFEIVPQVDKFNNYYINAEIGLESALSKNWSLRTFIQDTYYNVPATGRLKNDIKLVSGLAYKF